jgi:hypothetical protein
MTVAYGFGCKDIRGGAIGAGGTMGTVLTSVGKVYKDTVSMIGEDGTVAKHYSMNGRFPFLAVLTDGGLPLKFTLVDVSPANLLKWLGGTVNLETWSMSNDSFSQELSVEMDSLKGKTIQVARMFLYGKITWNANRTEIYKIEVTGEVMEPEDAATPPVKQIATPA